MFIFKIPREIHNDQVRRHQGQGREVLLDPVPDQSWTPLVNLEVYSIEDATLPLPIHPLLQHPHDQTLSLLMTFQWVQMSEVREQ